MGCMTDHEIEALKNALQTEEDPIAYLNLERQLENALEKNDANVESGVNEDAYAHKPKETTGFDGYTPASSSATARRITNTDTCPACKRKLLINAIDSVLVCDRCGFFTPLFDYSSHNLSYEQTQNMDNSSSCSYKRINHFNEFLSLLQAKESSKIPEEVLNVIREQCKKERIDVKQVKAEKIKSILKQKRLSKYYDNVSQILATLSGGEVVKILPSVEENLRNMFDAVQEPFDRHKPPMRTNFLSYNYVLYKCCELLGERELMKQFSLLKSREKLYEQDQLWKLICGDLGWEFRKTI